MFPRITLLGAQSWLPGLVSQSDQVTPKKTIISRQPHLFELTSKNLRCVKQRDTHMTVTVPMSFVAAKLAIF